MIRQPLGLSALLGASVLLVACAGDIDELRQWMEQQRRQTSASVSPLQPPSKFLPRPYDAGSGVDPFSAQKLSLGNRQETAQANALVAAEMNRRKEPLEAFPLDNMNMVGSMTRDQRRFALLRVENLLYQVKVGDYLGQNFGRITKISETEITLREVVQDTAGEWIERTSTLQLEEKGR